MASQGYVYAGAVKSAESAKKAGKAAKGAA